MYKVKLYPNNGSSPIILVKSNNARDAYYAHKEALKRGDVEEPEQVLTINPKKIIYAYGNNLKRLRKAAKLPPWM